MIKEPSPPLQDEEKEGEGGRKERYKPSSLKGLFASLET